MAESDKKKTVKGFTIKVNPKGYKEKWYQGSGKNKTGDDKVAEKKKEKKKSWFRLKDVGSLKNLKRLKQKIRKKKTKRMVEDKHMSGSDKKIKTPKVYTEKFKKSAKEKKRSLGEHAAEVTPKDAKIRSGVSSLEVTEGGVYPKYGEKTTETKSGSTTLRTKTGNKQAAKSYREAYKKARKEYEAKGDKKGSSLGHTFEWDGRKYNVETKEEKAARLAKKKKK